jgi:hypothetical protein
MRLRLLIILLRKKLRHGVLQRQTVVGAMTLSEDL